MITQKCHIPRCLKPIDFGPITSSQIHVFCDASLTGYGVCAYLRLSNGDRFHSAFLMGKSRLASIKPTTVPRLELTAATVAVRIGCVLQQELDMHVDSITYHTDSTTVLHYIRSERKRFPVFVSNRVQLIHNFSDITQWRYVNTVDNPADDASRGLDIHKLREQARWFHGPTFLCKPESEWPEQPDLTGKLNHDELSSEEHVVTMATNDTNYDDMKTTMTTLIDTYSSWYRLKKAVSVFLTVKLILLERISRKSTDSSESPKMNYSPFTVDKLEEAEISLIRYAQHQTFAREIELLSGKDTVPKRGRATKDPRIPRSSAVYRLDPFLDHNILRVGGRLARAQIPHETKHPMLLPGKSHITTLILRYVHHGLAHAGRNHVLAKLREKYWIVGANAAVRQLIRKCVTCRRLRMPTNTQIMADLPANRLTPAPVFTYTGVDFFGPYLVKEGRKELKRYGVLFTCLVSRAVHIETAVSLETDSFMNALRRFTARRGPIRELRCDNGSNFVGADRELQRAINDMEHNRIREQFLKHNITWKFNPPASSHMGGVWERQIRTVRKVLSQILREHSNRLDDESLRTLLCEVEAIINSRPLTSVSGDPNDLSPLTPNHILHMKPTMLPPPGKFEREDVYLRRRWRRVQYLANLFWSKWKKEYLLNLQQRPKWNKPQRNIQVGDVVLLKDENLPRYNWSLARITDTTKGRRGYVRSVTLKTQHSEFHRPIHKLVLLLPIEEQI